MYHVLRLGALVAVLGVLVSGCGDDGEADPSPTEPGSPSASEPSPTESGSGTEPDVTPASGRLMRLPGVSVRAPQKWSAEKDSVTLSWDAHDPESYWGIALYQVNGSVTSLDELIDVGVLNNFRGRPKISHDAELGGEPAFRATGRDALGPYVEYGAVHDGPSTLDSVGVTLSFGVDDSIPPGQRRRIEESVLASFEWR